MSEHDWVQENLASYNAGGLESDERDRLEKHIADCTECRAGLEELRSLDHKIGSLFAAARPSVAIEDRMIQTLRAESQQPWRPHWALTAAAAVLLLGCVGVVADNILHPENSGRIFREAFLVANNTDSMSSGNTRFQTGLAAPSGTAKAETKGYESGAKSVRDVPNRKNEMWVEAYRRQVGGGESGTVEHLKDVDQLAKEEGERNPAELLNSVGYYPPARALVEKGSSRTHTNFGGPSPQQEFFSQTRLGKVDAEQSAVAGKKAPADSRSADSSRDRVLSGTFVGSGTPSIESTAKQAPVPNSFNGRSVARSNDQPANNPAKVQLPKTDAELKDVVVSVNETQTGSLLFGVGKDAKKSSTSDGQLGEGRLLGGAAERYQTQRLFALGGKAATSLEEVRQAKEEWDRQVRAQSDKAQNQAGQSDGKAESKQKEAQKTEPDSKVPSDENTQRQKPPAPTQPTPASRKVIRSGDVEFEVQSFDSAVAGITKLINDIKGGFVATINSDKLPNGKVRGAVVVRVPPETLDTLLLDLRKELGKLGELKGMKVGSQDITKQYTDLESHLRAALAMQERLLQMIKEGKGAIKDLLQAEKELGVWRTKIEELEGEIRYYNNLVALSTLTINLYEKEIRAPFGVIETERVLMGLEVEDVEKAHKQVLAAVAEVKGRISKSELKQHAPDQLSAIVNFEVAPESAGPLRDRLRQLGNVARLEADRLQQTEGGTGRPQDGKTKQNDTQFFVSLFNLATFTPRETISVQLAVKDVAGGYRALQEAVSRIKGKLVNFDFDERDKQNITAQLDFDIRRADEATMNPELSKIGDVFSRKVVRTPDKDDVLDSKLRMLVSLVSQSRIPPRETVILGIEVANVDRTAEHLAAFVTESGGRIAESNIAHERNGRVTAKLVYDVPLSSATGLVQKFGAEGAVRVQKSSRNEQVPDSALSIARIDVTLSNTDLIVPSDEGLWPQVRRGLSTSVTALSWSLTVVIIGVCFVLPWVIVIYTTYRIVLRFRRGRAASPA
jgi:hypothetical protein